MGVMGLVLRKVLVGAECDRRVTVALLQELRDHLLYRPRGAAAQVVRAAAAMAVQVRRPVTPCSCVRSGLGRRLGQTSLVRMLRLQDEIPHQLVILIATGSIHGQHERTVWLTVEVDKHDTWVLFVVVRSSDRMF